MTTFKAWIAALSVSLLAFLAFAVTPALAKGGYGLATGHFGSGPCVVSPSEPCEGKFNEPTSVAVNSSITEPTAGDVYVLDKGNDRVERFSATGEYLGQFNGSGEYEVVSGGIAKKETGTPAPSGAFLEPEGIAVDDSGETVLEDPSVGDVYVADVGHEVIDKFSATGEYEGQLTGFGTLLGVAVDTSGNLWTYEEGTAQAYEFSDTGVPVEQFETHCDCYPNSTGGAPGLAVDSSDNVYRNFSNERWEEFERTTGNLLATNYDPDKPGTPGSGALAINPGKDALFVDMRGSISRFAPLGDPLTPLETFPSSGLSDSEGVAVNTTSAEGVLYASEREADEVDVFTVPPPEKPEILSESAEKENGFFGKLAAVINPDKLETTCLFEYSTEGKIGTGEALEGTVKTAPCETPLAAEEFGEPGATEPNVRIFATKTTYYRVVAENEKSRAEGQPVVGKVQAFIPLPSVVGYEIEGVTHPAESASGLTLAGATLEAGINDNYENAEYHFEYSTSKQVVEEDGGTPVPGAEMLEIASGALPASGVVSGLEPDTRYYYRVVVENETTRSTENLNGGEPVRGEVEEFKTQSVPFVSAGEAQSITGTRVTLAGTVTPPVLEAKYHFAYISEASFQAALAKGAADPYEEGETTATLPIGPSETPQVVGPFAAAGLLPGTTYHYTLVAENEFGIRYSEDRTFTTSAGTPPIVITGGASNLSQSSATLSGTVNTNSLQTLYGFEVGTQPGSFGPATGLGSLGGALTESVSLTLGELQPGTTYYYRVMASNADGSVRGVEASFTTPGFATLIAGSVALPLVPVPMVAFPEEGAGVTGPDAELKVVKHSVKGHTVTIVVYVSSAGKLVATGDGLSKATKTAGRAGDVIVRMVLTKAKQARLAKHKGLKLPVKVKLAFTPRAGSKLSASVAVLIG